MSKLVQKVKWPLSGLPNMEMYMYGNASVEANKEMQEPLEKLYKYENQLDMRESVREYVDGLYIKIKKCETEIANTKDVGYEARMMARLDALTEVRNDLRARLGENDGEIEKKEIIAVQNSEDDYRCPVCGQIFTGSDIIKYAYRRCYNCGQRVDFTLPRNRIN
jgi:rubrerythrin